MKLRVETSEIAEAYKSFPEFRDFNWEGELSSQNEIYAVVFFRRASVFTGLSKKYGYI